jgi:hypothetical protein
MLFRSFIVILLLASASPLSVQTTIPQQAEQRDLSRYKEGGTFDLSWGAGPEKLERLKAEARKFLWEQWRRKSPAHCVVIFHNLEGDPTTHNLYIEPDEKGRWRVMSEAVSDCCWFHSREGKERELLTWPPVAYYVVERVEAMNGQATAIYIPDEAHRQPETYYLQLRRDAPGRNAAAKDSLFIL